MTKGEKIAQRKLIRLEGRRFGRLKVLRLSGTRPYPCGKIGYIWACVCECGKSLTCLGSDLRNGSSRSCGCSRIQHGHGRKHLEGKYRSETYNTWASMIQRCTNPLNGRWKDYGGRGIKICKRWLTFENFLADMGQRPSRDLSLDRYPNPNGNYEPKNCRWATRKEQQNNSRFNRRIEHNGTIKTLTEWANFFGIRIGTLATRIRRGWTFQEAINGKRIRG